MNMIDETIKNRVDAIADGPKDKILELMNIQSLTEEIIDEKNHSCQLEIIAGWDDKDKGTVRIAAFLTRPADKWWKSFFSNSVYERLVDMGSLK